MATEFSGYDLGTMNMCSATINVGANNEAVIKAVRNMFIEVDTSTISINEIENTDLDYIIDKDGDDERCFIFGEDAFKFGQIFNINPRRPMRNGVVSTKDIEAIDVITLMAKSILSPTKDGICVYSVPAQAVDVDIPPVNYHERVFSQVLGSLGYKSTPLNEGMAVIFDNCKKEKFTGIGISFGCGLTNVACSYRGVKTLEFSISRGGDWIDKCAGESTGTQFSRVTNLKEKKLDLTDPKFKSAKNKSERRVLQALDCYYRELINYALKVFINQFNEHSENLSIDESIPIVVSGGTSLPKGFIELFREIFSETKDFPYDVSEIRAATDPLNAVAKGCLIYNLWNNKKDKVAKK